MNKKFYLIPLIIIISAFITAVVVHGSYVNSGNIIYNYIYSAPQTDDSKDDLLAENNYSSYSDILNDSDAIIKCEVLDDRIITDKAFITPVKVLNVYKGNSELTNKTIQILEDVSIQTFSSDKIMITSFHGYIPLNSKKQYILCINKKKWNSNKNVSSFENSQYYINTASAFGMFQISNNKQTKLIDYTKYSETINSLKNIDVFTDSQNFLDLYYKLKNELFKKYEITIS